MTTQYIIEDIDAIQDKYCRDCIVKQQLRKERGKTGAHKFCITTCSVGKKLQFLGQELMKMSDR